MSVVNFDLRPDWLRRHELPGYGPGRRGFDVSVGGTRYVLVVRHLPETSAMAYAEPEEDPVTPSDGDLLMLLAQAFLGSLPQFPPAAPDVAEAWEAFRREARETTAAKIHPWELLSPELREAFAVGVQAAMGEGQQPARSPRRTVPVEVRDSWGNLISVGHRTEVGGPDR